MDCSEFPMLEQYLSSLLSLCLSPSLSPLSLLLERVLRVQKTCLQARLFCFTDAILMQCLMLIRKACH